MGEKAFNRSSLRTSMRGIGERGATARAQASVGTADVRSISISEVAKAHRAADLVSAKAQKHYEKHRAEWVDKRFTQLLTKYGNTLSLAPPGVATDPKTAMMRRASREVADRHGQRLQRIEKARYNAVDGKALRPTRKMDWGRGLGE